MYTKQNNGTNYNKRTHTHAHTHRWQWSVYTFKEKDIHTNVYKLLAHHIITAHDVHSHLSKSAISSEESTSCWSNPSRIRMSSWIWAIFASVLIRLAGWVRSMGELIFRYTLFRPSGPITLLWARIIIYDTASFLLFFIETMNRRTRERCCWQKGLLPARPGSSALRVIAGRPRVLLTAFRHSTLSTLASAVSSCHDWQPYQAVQ